MQAITSDTAIVYITRCVVGVKPACSEATWRLVHVYMNVKTVERGDVSSDRVSAGRSFSTSQHVSASSA